MALTKNEIIRKIKTKNWISRKKKNVSPSIALDINALISRQFEDGLKKISLSS